MTIKYESVVPWGRSYQEYLDIFALSESDLNKKILGCGDGPASFNCIMNQKGKKVVSIDPIYKMNVGDIEKRIEETFNNVIDQTRQNQDKFVWTKIKDVEHLGNVRMEAMKDFLNDFEAGKKDERYVYAELPVLPFGDHQFHLSLSSHFLFLHDDNLSLEFHFQALSEMLRVSKEVRIFPLLNVNAVRSAYVDKVNLKYQNTSYHVEEIKVDYEFQKGGNTMLKIKRIK